MYIEKSVSIKCNYMSTSIINENKWAVFNPKKHSLECKIADKPKEGEFCTLIKKGRIIIPSALILKYGLNKSVRLLKMSDSEFSFQSACSGVIPKFPGSILYRDTSRYEGEVENEYTEGLIGFGSLTINRSDRFLINLINACVKVHTGAVKYIEICCEGCRSEIDEIKSIYGDQFSGFNAEYMEYRNANKSTYQFHIPSVVKRNWELKPGDSVRLLKLTDGRVIITPIPKTDEITGDKILPEIKPIKEVLMCEDCDESDTIKELILELKKMQELVVSYNGINKMLMEKLESQMKENLETKSRLEQIEALLKR